MATQWTGINGEALKILILIVLVAMLIALGYTLYVMLAPGQEKDRGKRMVWGLTARVALGLLVFSIVLIGLATGKLRSQAPWDRHLEQSELTREGGEP